MPEKNQGRNEQFQKTNEGNAAYPEYSDREHADNKTSLEETKEGNCGYPE
ncbi:hypothetical protein IM538_22430 [Cytobacillus suaedae]|uniref:Uncharacterized protein n=1 Tax=Litchfieldia luteola TaxID=682179 RepID=A0ABR9QFL8_9BACI|nr:hypothetical protein [Cytobacillus luteolus]MBE4907292.1 hypothetical protein [Cytobacillus luteolus]MBP1943227.1 hypothetical protein [Cytobacillus luteolus]QOR66482.1 hypothetical protein IM538_22430 [Cytobacillus suaedae]